MSEDELLTAGFREARRNPVLDRWDKGWWWTCRRGVDEDGDPLKPWSVCVRMWDFPKLRPDLQVGWDCELYLDKAVGPDGPNSGSLRVTASCRDTSPASVLAWADATFSALNSLDVSSSKD